MGTTEQKLNFIKRAKRNLKNQINTLFGENITDETPFIDYAGKLGDFYNRLPKTTFSKGTSLNLGSTLKGKLDYDLEDDKYIMGLGDTSQDTTTGKNLYDVNDKLTGTNWSSEITVESDDFLSVDYTNNTGSTAFLNFFTKVNNLLETSTDYTCIVEFKDVTVTTGTSIYPITFYNNNGQFTETYSISSDFTGTKSAVNTTLSSFSGCSTSLRSYIRITAGGRFKGKIRLSLLKGDVTGNIPSYEPFTGGIPAPNPSYPENINVVTGTQEVVVRGKNLFNGDLVTTTNTTNWLVSFSNNILTIKHNNSYSTGYPSLNLGTLASGTYVLSGTLGTQIGLYKNGLYSSMLSNNSTFSVSGNEEIMLVWASSLIPSGETKTYTNIQLEQNSTATSYEPYITPTTTTLHLGTNEFCKIGDYADELLLDLDNDKVYKNKKINNKTADDLTTNNLRYASQGVYLTGIGAIKTPKGRVYCNCLTYKNTTDTAWNELNGLYIGQLYNNYDNIYINKIYTNQQLLEALVWLRSINFKVYYILAEEVQEEITDEDIKEDLYNLYAMQSIEGNTIIEVSGNLAMNLKIRALKGE